MSSRTVSAPGGAMGEGVEVGADADGSRVAITGAAGMLGTALVDVFSSVTEVFATDRRIGLRRPRVSWDVLDVSDSDDLRAWLLRASPDVVIHCAGIVDVDLCERRPEMARAVHVAAAETIAGIQQRRRGAVVYVSTDSVFDGTKSGPYVEGDATDPLNAYARTKLLGEEVTLECRRGIVLRTNIFGWTFGPRPSIAEWVLSGLETQSPLSMFDDVLFTPINVSHLAAVVHACVELGAAGRYHAGGGQALSKYDFALLVADVFGLPTGSLRARSVDDAGLQAPRPKNMALSSERLEALLGASQPGAREGLDLMRRQRESAWPEGSEDSTSTEAKGSGHGPA